MVGVGEVVAVGMGGGRGGVWKGGGERKRESDVFTGLTFISVWGLGSRVHLKGSSSPKLLQLLL